jgi:hypothetical protein
MDANSIRASADRLGGRQFSLGGLYEAVVLFQVFVRETRTAAFICLQKDRDRQISVF